MPRKKTAADERYNQRRRLERKAARLHKLGRVAESNEVYAEAQQFRAKARPAARSRNTTAARRDAIFRQQINTAGSIGSQYSDVRRSGFFSATKQIWAGKEGDRLTAIKNYFYQSTSGEYPNEHAAAFKKWAKEHGVDLRNRSLFAIEQYIYDMNKDVLDEEGLSVSGGTPRAFQKLINFG